MYLRFPPYEAILSWRKRLGSDQYLTSGDRDVKFLKIISLFDVSNSISRSVGCSISSAVTILKSCLELANIEEICKFEEACLCYAYNTGMAVTYAISVVI